VEQARARFAARVVAVLEERDLRDFDRIAQRFFDAFGREPPSPARNPSKET
jgi:hypothetical protein